MSYRCGGELTQMATAMSSEYLSIDIQFSPHNKITHRMKDSAFT